MKISENFNCQVIKLESELLISLQGNLDMYTTSILQETIWRYLEPSITKITIDCGWVQYVDSSFLQLLTRLSTLVDKVRIINASRTVRRIFTITSLDKTFIEDD
ncbi:MAG: STAS domain-containing protein [Firmicutes bacterium]|nr:STAS domain-containing protein [Bacillota bacterium]